MENQLFTYTGGWDQADTLCFLFYDCTLTRDIGTFSEGDKVSVICMVYDRGIMEFYGGENDEKVLASFKLNLSVEQISA